jgi:hypothetical protein
LENNGNAAKGVKMYIIKDYTDDYIIGIYNTYSEAISNLPKNFYCAQYGGMVTYCICFYDEVEQENEYFKALKYELEQESLRIMWEQACKEDPELLDK